MNASVLLQAVLDSRDGITVSDPCLPDNPLVFFNNAFTKMTGYSREDIFSRNCRFLRGIEEHQRDMVVLRDSIKNAKRCLVTLKNFHKNGTIFWNELSKLLFRIFNDENPATEQLDTTASSQLGFPASLVIQKVRRNNSSDLDVIGGILSPACYIDQSFPSVLFNRTLP